MKRFCTLAFSLVVLAACGKDESGAPATGDKPAPAAGVAPGKSGTPMDVVAIKAIQVPGYKITFTEGALKNAASGGFEAEDGSSNGSVFAAPCEMCQRLDEQVWTGNRDNLMSMLSTAVKDDPNTIFEIAKKTIAGHEVMTTYSVGWVKTDNSVVSSHGLSVFWNDGVDNLVLQIHGPHPTAESFEEYRAKVDRAPLDRAAEAMVAAYVPALAK